MPSDLSLVMVRRSLLPNLDAFLAAARDGDFERLLRVLDPDVTWRTHTAHGVEIVVGAAAVAADAQRRARVRGQAHRVLVNGEPGLVAWSTTGKPIGLMGCTIIDERIIKILSVRDPERLATIGLPGRPG